MNMEDKKILQDLIKKADTGPNIVDIGFKLLTFISFSLLAWIFTTVSDMESEFQKLNINYQYMAKSIEKFDEFASEPRFTISTFDSRIGPITKDIENLKAVNAVRQAVHDDLDEQMEDLQGRIARLEFELEKKK